MECKQKKYVEEYRHLSNKGEKDKVNFLGILLLFSWLFVLGCYWFCLQLQN